MTSANITPSPSSIAIETINVIIDKPTASSTSPGNCCVSELQDSCTEFLPRASVHSYKCNEMECDEDEESNSDQDIVIKESESDVKVNSCGGSATRVRQSSREVGERITLDILEAYYNMPLTWAARELKVSNTMLKKLCRKYGIQRWPHRQIRSIDNDLEKQRNLRSRAVSVSEIAAADELIQLLQEKRSIVTKTASCGLSASLRSVIFMARPGEIDAEQLFSSGVIPAFQVQKTDRNRSDQSIQSNRPSIPHFLIATENSEEITNNANGHGNAIANDNALTYPSQGGWRQGGFIPTSVSYGGPYTMHGTAQSRYTNIQPQPQHMPQMSYPPNQPPFQVPSGWIPISAVNENYQNFATPSNINIASNSFQNNSGETNMFQVMQQQQAILQHLGYGSSNNNNPNRGPEGVFLGGFTQNFQPSFHGSNQINQLSSRPKTEVLARQY